MSFTAETIQAGLAAAIKKARELKSPSSIAIVDDNGQAVPTGERGEVLDDHRRILEIRNFLDHVVAPTRSRRGRA